MPTNTSGEGHDYEWRFELSMFHKVVIKKWQFKKGFVKYIKLYLKSNKIVKMQITQLNKKLE